eukprot:TRINITY_DN29431_c0_g1_i1.p1 TRINITY_DN29431_c0_g1~~TRINITY_DN29431_c0_g1_i1.p1  ORF type:complete len:235 (+),score=41.59 TRINITY_DN29431_c0_g1_i1:203-907(+)
MTSKKVDEKKRREENLLNAAALRKSATEYSASFDYNTFLRDAEKQRSSQFDSHIGGDEPTTNRAAETVEVLKVKGRTLQPFELEKMRASQKDRSDTTPAKDLPPWELDSASQPFNMDSGRFGNPEHGRLMESSDGRIRLMPQHESQTRYKAATGLLPKEDQKQVLQHTVYRDAEHTRVLSTDCLLYTSDAADEEDSVDLGGRRIIKKKNISRKVRSYKLEGKQKQYKTITSHTQ